MSIAATERDTVDSGGSGGTFPLMGVIFSALIVICIAAIVFVKRGVLPVFDSRTSSGAAAGTGRGRASERDSMSRATRKRVEQRRSIVGKEAAKASYGVCVVTLNDALVVTSTESTQNKLTSNAALAAFVNKSTPAATPVAATESRSSPILQRFVMTEAGSMKVIWQPYETLKREWNFSIDYSAFVGSKLRIVPTRFDSAGWNQSLECYHHRLPVALRGITVLQLAAFHRDYPGKNSRAKQDKLMEDCPSGCSYIEWKVGRAQLPQAIVSYSWDMDWEVIIDCLQCKTSATAGWCGLTF
jgi:hypothetical protein